MGSEKWLPWTTNMLDDDLVNKIKEVYRVKEYHKGYWIFKQGDISDTIYLLLDGRVEINMLSKDGKKIILAIHEPRCLFGELIMDNNLRLTSAVCLTDITVAALDSPLDLGSYHYEAKLYQALSYSTTRKLKIQIQQLSEQIFEDAADRIEKLLLGLCENLGKEENGQLRVDLPVTHQMIADMTGCSRPTVSLVIGELSRNNKIIMGRNMIIFKKDL